MAQDIFALVKELQERHPEIVKALASYHLSLDAYNKAVASIESTTFQQAPTYSLTTEARYNADISKST